jgi:hypothetical protein
MSFRASGHRLETRSRNCWLLPMANWTENVRSVGYSECKQGGNICGQSYIHLSRFSFYRLVLHQNPWFLIPIFPFILVSFSCRFNNKVGLMLVEVVNFFRYFRTVVGLGQIGSKLLDQHSFLSELSPSMEIWVL